MRTDYGKMVRSRDRVIAILVLSLFASGLTLMDRQLTLNRQDRIISDSTAARLKHETEDSLRETEVQGQIEILCGIVDHQEGILRMEFKKMVLSWTPDIGGICQ